MKHYIHITEGERWQIYGYLRDGKKPEQISKLLGRNPGTISREIKKGMRNGRYEPMGAQLDYERRRSNINAGRRKVTRDGVIAQTIRKYLIEHHRMPGSISGREKVPVSIQTIYNYIRECEPSLEKYLVRKKGYKKRKEGSGEKKVGLYRSIDERPAIVELRIRQGDVEIDTIHSAGDERKGGLLTITDRVDKFIQGGKLTRRSKEETSTLLINILISQKEKLLTITSDNGKEFNDFQTIEEVLDTPVYFADPYCSSQRGSNEQTNGMVRVFYPKGTDFTNISDEEIQKVFSIINLKPRKSLGYLTAYESHYGIKLDL